MLPTALKAVHTIRNILTRVTPLPFLIFSSSENNLFPPVKKYTLLSSAFCLLFFCLRYPIDTFTPDHFHSTVLVHLQNSRIGFSKSELQSWLEMASGSFILSKFSSFVTVYLGNAGLGCLVDSWVRSPLNGDYRTPISPVWSLKSRP